MLTLTDKYKILKLLAVKDDFKNEEYNSMKQIINTENESQYKDVIEYINKLEEDKSSSFFDSDYVLFWEFEGSGDSGCIACDCQLCWSEYPFWDDIERHVEKLSSTYDWWNNDGGTAVSTLCLVTMVLDVEYEIAYIEYNSYKETISIKDDTI